MITRRTLLVTVPLAAAALASRRTWATEPIPVTVPNHAIGAIVSVVAGARVTISAAELDPAVIRIGAGEPVSVAKKVLLKGVGDAQARFLDDPRNAARVGAQIRTAISKAQPGLSAELKANHKAWSRALALKVLRWSQTLSSSKVAGKRIADPHGRVYLLEWAGAIVDPNGAAGPDLAALPAGPAESTAESYETYIESLVAALG